MSHFESIGKRAKLIASAASRNDKGSSDPETDYAASARWRSFLFLNFFSFLLTACTSAYHLKDDSLTSPDRVYPNGIYRHEVTLHTADGQTHRFNGVVKLSPQRIEVVGLSFFGTTVFRITDDLRTEATIEIFVYPLKKHEGRLRKIYVLLKKLLLLSPKGEQKGLKLDAYDEHHIPRHVEITGEKYQVEVKVTGYDL